MLATDGSEYSAGAERIALALAEQCGARLAIVSVVVSNPEAEVVAPDMIRAAEEETRSTLAGVYERAVTRGLAAETLAPRGIDPYTEIAAAAEAQRADVIVMGRRGKRGLARRMLGDATSRMIRTRTATYWWRPKAPISGARACGWPPTARVFPTPPRSRRRRSPRWAGCR